MSLNEPARAYKGNICLSVRMMWIRLLNPDCLRDFAQESWDMVHARLRSLIPECAAYLPASYLVALALENNKADLQGKQ